MRPQLFLAILLAALPCMASGDEILVAAASSLREPVGEIARRFEKARPGTRVTLTFGSSNLLANQIAAGAPVEVFLSADARNLDALATRGLLREETRLAFASNRLVLVGTPGSAPRLVEPGDLLGVRRFALPPPAVPLGHYAREWLARHGLLETLAGRVVQTQNARATLAALELGTVDAALVYATDARLARRARLAFTPPEAEQPAILYVAGITRRGGAGEAAEAFLRFLGEEGAPVLREAGFLEPPGKAASAP